MNEPIGVGVLGYGYAGRCFHAYLLRFETRLRLRAVASRDPGRREQAERDYPGVTTSSEGTEPNRFVVIAPGG